MFTNIYFILYLTLYFPWFVQSALYYVILKCPAYLPDYTLRFYTVLHISTRNMCVWMRTYTPVYRPCYREDNAAGYKLHDTQQIMLFSFPRGNSNASSKAKIWGIQSTGKFTCFLGLVHTKSSFWCVCYKMHTADSKKKFLWYRKTKNKDM
jgi:hypothetical protein